MAWAYRSLYKVGLGYLKLSKPTFRKLDVKGKDTRLAFSLTIF